MLRIPVRRPYRDAKSFLSNSGGGAKRNHRKRPNRSPRHGRAGPGLAMLRIPVRRPYRDAKSYLSNTGGYASLHHRLISIVPPGQKRIS